MKKRIIAIDISDGFDKLTEQSKVVLEELQLKLFDNGYRWVKSVTEVQKFFTSGDRYIVLIDEKMYTMSKESLKYLSKESDVKYAGSATSYFRYLKLKKLNMI